MKPTKIIFKNFKSFEDTEVIFPTDDTGVLTLGDNRDSMGSNSNGAGKTGLFSGISFLLFGITTKLGYVDDIIRTGTKQAIVEGYFTHQDDEVKIIRKRGTTNTLEFWVNGLNDHPKSTATVTQNSLLQYLDITGKDYYTDFINTTYFSIDSLEAFASNSTPSEKKMELITRMLNLSRLETAGKDVKTRRQTVDKQLITKQYLLNKITDNLNDCGSVEVNRSDKIKLEADIKELEEEIMKLTKQSELYKTIVPLKKQLEAMDVMVAKNEFNHADKLDHLITILNLKENRLKLLLNGQEQKKKLEIKLSKLPKIDDIGNNIDELSLTQTNLASKETNLLAIVRELQSTINRDIKLIAKALTCPKCETDLMINPDTKLENFDKDTIQERLNVNDKEITGYRNELETVQDKNIKARYDLDQWRNTSNTLTLLIKEINLIKLDPEEITFIEIEITEVGVKRKAITVEYEEERVILLNGKREIEAEIEKYDNVNTLAITSAIDDKRNSVVTMHNTIGRLDQQETQRKQLQFERDKLDRNIKSCETVISKFLLIENCYTTIRRWKIENFLPEFENISNRYLSDIKCGYQITLDTRKEKKSARKDENKYKLGFTINVVDENGFPRGLDTYSKGERVRIAICLGLALKEIALQRNNMPFEFTLLDDVAGEIDETGGEELSMLVNNIRGLKMVITQNNNLAKNFVHVIKVIKENGVSIIVKEK